MTSLIMTKEALRDDTFLTRFHPNTILNKDENGNFKQLLGERITNEYTHAGTETVEGNEIDVYVLTVDYETYLSQKA